VIEVVSGVLGDCFDGWMWSRCLGNTLGVRTSSIMARCAHTIITIKSGSYVQNTMLIKISFQHVVAIVILHVHFHLNSRISILAKPPACSLTLMAFPGEQLSTKVINR
jgi:hypothetical protein